MKKWLIVNCPQYAERLSDYTRLIRDSERDSFIKYYPLYEYTDDICVLEDNPMYPGIINYVKTGLLTEDEMIKALLHED